ncbi:MAG: tetratricopeptide repeat protein [Bacteroidota bacterium]
MRKYAVLSLHFACLSLIAFGQASLKGNVYFQNSAFTPAVGVQILAEGSNGDYSKSDGSYTLEFPDGKAGQPVYPNLGENNIGTDKNGLEIELVNSQELALINLPEDPDQYVTPIIVCPKGARDIAARRYYNILKSSSEKELAKIKAQLDGLFAQQEKNYARISDLSQKLEQLNAQKDSLKIYEDAFYIASINTDGATKRVKYYIQLLDEGKSIQEAREVLSIDQAEKDAQQGLAQFEAALTELQTRARASFTIFDYEDAIACEEKIINNLRTAGMNPARIAGHASNVATLYHLMSEDDQAEQWIVEAIEMEEGVSYSDSLKLQKYYSNYGVFLESNGNYNKAFTFNQKALEILRNQYPTKYFEILTSYNNLASLCMRMDQDSFALFFLNTSLSIKKKLYGATHPDLAVTYTNLAYAYKNYGDVNKAIECIENCQKIQLKHYGLNHPEYARALETKANMLHHFSEPYEAVQLQDSAITILTQALSPKHSRVFLALENLAIYKKSTGNLVEAKRLMDSVLAEKLRQFPPDHFKMAQTYSRYAELLNLLNQKEKAITYYRKTIQIKENHIGLNNSSLRSEYNNLGTILLFQEKYTEAIELYHKGIASPKQPTERKSSDLLTGYANLGLAYFLKQDYKESLTWFTTYFEGLTPSENRNSRSLAKSYGYASAAAFRLKKDSLGLSYLLRSKDLYDNILAPDDLTRGLLSHNLGQGYETYGSIEESIVYYGKAVSFFESYPQETPNYLFKSLDKLQGRLADVGKHVEAAKFQRKLVQISPTYDTWNLLGLRYYYAQDYPNAIEAYKQSISLDSTQKNAIYFNNIGTAYAKNQQFDLAQTAFEQFQALQPENGRSYRNWAMLYAIQGKKKEAMKNLEKAVELGFTDKNWFLSDSSMEELRETKPFKKLLNKL